MLRTLPLLVALAFLAACGGASGGPNEADPLTDGTFPGGEILVMLEDPDDEHEVEEIREDFDGVAIRRVGTSSFFVLDLPAGTNVARVLKELDDDLRIVDSHPNYLAESPEGDPSDVATLGSDLVDTLAVQPALDPLGLAAAHAFSTGAGVLVAVVDTGVDFDHPFLQAALEPGGYDFIGNDEDPSDERNFLDDDGDGIEDEQFGHGTFVASLVLLVAPDARILPVRVLDDEGFGTASTVAAGIVWAVDAGALVINVSVDVANDSEAVKDAIGYAEDRDVLVVAPVGNEAADRVAFPARFGSVLGVAAVDAFGLRAPFSNVGNRVDLVAPGVELLGAYPVSANPAGTARWSGTSFAAPLASGAAALVRARFPGLPRDAAIERLRQTALSVDALNPGLAGGLGAGLVQPAAAVQ